MSVPIQVWGQSSSTRVVEEATVPRVEMFLMRSNHIHVSRIVPFLAHTTKRPDATLGLGCAANGLNVERDGAVRIEYFELYSTFLGASMIALCKRVRGSKLQCQC